MMARKLTDKQRLAIEALEAARAAGLGIGAYARANGLNPRQIYDAVAGLRKHGHLPPTSAPRPRRRKAAFVAVDVVAGRSPQSRTGMLCRLIYPGGVVIECGEWPPATWLSSMMAE